MNPLFQRLSSTLRLTRQNSGTVQGASVPPTSCDPQNDTHADEVRFAETHRERVSTDAALRSLAAIAIPADLQLRLRVALSHERVRADRRLSGRIAHRWHLLRENTLRPIAVHGLVAAAAMLVLIAGAASIGTVVPQQAVEANDIPLAGFSSPRYLYSTSGIHHPIASATESPLMVQARVSADGRVYSYRVLSGALDPLTETALRERMLSSVFRPARVLGEPVRGTVVLTFADVEVHG